MAIPTLPLQFKSKGFTYTQVERHDDLAIYAQTKPHWPTPRYEIIVIRIAPERTWPDGRVTPERESYPKSSEWGVYGFTVYTLAEAQALLRDLQTKRAAAATAEV